MAKGPPRPTGENDINGVLIYENSVVEIAPKWEDGSANERAGQRFVVKWGWWDGGDSTCVTWVLTNDEYPVSITEGQLWEHKNMYDGTIYGFRGALIVVK